MELSILIARIAAALYLATGIAILNGNLNLKKSYKELKKDHSLTLMLGAGTLFLGMLIINLHNIWVKDWRVLITIIGWVLLTEGILYIVSPKKLLSLFKKLPTNQLGWGIFTICAGLLFGYLGFFY